MNNAGLPGTGIGGLFYVVLALVMPIVELYATVRGRSSRARWRQVGAQFLQACAIIAAVAGSVALAQSVAGSSGTMLRVAGHSLAVVSVIVSATTLGALVVTLRVWSLISTRTPSARPVPPAPQEQLNRTEVSAFQER